MAEGDRKSQVQTTILKRRSLVRDSNVIRSENKAAKFAPDEMYIYIKLFFRQTFIFIVRSRLRPVQFLDNEHVGFPE